MVKFNADSQIFATQFLGNQTSTQTDLILLRYDYCKSSFCTYPVSFVKMTLIRVTCFKMVIGRTYYMSYIISYASKKSEICIQIVKGIQLAKRTGVIKSRVIGARVASEQILGLAYFQKSLTPSFCMCLNAFEGFEDQKWAILSDGIRLIQ